MKMAILSESSSVSLACRTIFFSNMVKDQNIKRSVKELENADRALIKYATLSGAAKKENIRPRSIYNGAPGGWPTSSL